MDQFPTKYNPVRHELSNIDADALLATCSVCGSAVQIVKAGKFYACLNAKRRSNSTTMVSHRQRDAPGKEAALIAQGWKCAICRDSIPDLRSGHYDHSHMTGAWRGVLCPACNKGLGFFRDDVERLTAAIAYLKGAA